MAVSQWAVPAAKRVAPSSADASTRAAIFRNGISGLNAAAATGVDRHQTRLGLWRIKTGQGPARSAEDVHRTRVNMALVPSILGLFTEDTGLTTRRTGLLASRQRPWQIATVDALTGDGGQVDVTTTTSNSIHYWVHPVTGDELTPTNIHARVVHDLAVTGRSHGWVACLVLDTRELLVRRITRDADEIDALNTGEAEFWEHVTGDVAPAITALDKDLLADVHPIARDEVVEAPQAADLRDRRERLLDEIAFLESEVAEIDAQTRTLAGPATIVTTDGVKVASWDQNGKFDADQFTQDHPRIARRYSYTALAIDWRKLLEDRPEFAAYRGRVLRYTASHKGRKKDGDRSRRAAWTHTKDAA